MKYATTGQSKSCVRSVLPDSDPALRQVCEPVDVSPPKMEIFSLVDDLEDTVNHHKALGIAANQVGVSKRVIYVNGFKFTGHMINPEITWRSESKQRLREGCLSIPGELVLRKDRSQKIRVKYFTRDGDECSVDLVGIDALIAQHEIDHLDGKLMTDEER